MSDGIRARLRRPLDARVDLGSVLSGAWTTLGAGELARRPIGIAGADAVLGDIFDLSGSPTATIRFEGDLAMADRLGAGLSEGAVVVDGAVGDDVGSGMSGGSMDVHGNAGARAGGAAADARRGMTGGELLIRGSAGEDPGTRMRAGSGRDHRRRRAPCRTRHDRGDGDRVRHAGARPGALVQAGVDRRHGQGRDSADLSRACTYQPAHVRVTLLRLRRQYALDVEERYLTGFYRRYSGDLAELGRGEILAWTAA